MGLAGGGVLITRILVVDDCEPWRKSVRSILECNPSFQVIGEARDGIEAIGKAAMFRPDVVLLDVGMPRLNGIEAARQIKQKACPESTIVFLTQEDDCDIRSAALDTGAAAYVLKSTAASEILLTVASAWLHRILARHQLEFPPLEPAILFQGL